MTVPIQISWDLYQGKVSVWCECIVAGVRRAVLLPRLDTIFSPEDEAPARETPYSELKWRLVSPTEADWERYRALVEKQAARHGITLKVQRVESLAGWAGGTRVRVPQYHLWLFRDADVGAVIERLYDELDPWKRRELWGWLLRWTAPTAASQPYDPR